LGIGSPKGRKGNLIKSINSTTELMRKKRSPGSQDGAYIFGEQERGEKVFTMLCRGEEK